MNYKDITKDISFDQWIDSKGKTGSKEIGLEDLGVGNKYMILFCFQSWCPGCHSSGFPSLKKIVNTFGDENKKMGFAVIQTVFEGFQTNTFEALKETYEKYGLSLPFIQDNGSEQVRPQIMEAFLTKGTPWFIFINEKGDVEHSGFHIDPEKAILYLKEKHT